MEMTNEEKLPISVEAKEFMTSDFVKYTNANGYHFTDSLADFCSKLLINADGTAHRWSADRIRMLVIAMGKEKNPTDTWGDIAYVSNVLYSDLYPKVIKSPNECIASALDMSFSDNWYDGCTFMRFVTDMIGRGMTIEWNKYI